MMKKLYEAPKMEEILLCTENCLMGGSDVDKANVKEATDYGWNWSND